MGSRRILGGSGICGLLAALALSGCATTSAPPAQPQTLTEYHIGREDVLEVSVWHSEDLSRTLPVRPDGKISLPLLGELTAQGKTAGELAGEIQQKLRPYVEDPKVAVIVREVNAPRFHVIGEVQKPGTFPLRGSVTLLQALAAAGGFNPFADQDAITIVRQQEGQATQRYTVRYSDMVKGNKGDAIYLDAGDTIYVP
ncbi:MAG: polysaccharide biosynthesis/export family protein [Deltaproteobacteria bacterium]|nr:polysaccharide biosynthesis/export family protein [Deltaproteobacteria bacterium]